jgi:hypothetical protein
MGQLFGLVKAFLKDFYTQSREGTRRHRKGVILFLSFVLLCFGVIGAALFKVSETPFFCGVCHNMQVFVDSWKASSHRNVGCIACHYKPGFLNHVRGKWKDGQLSLAYFITGKRPTKPHAEIDDASCLQSGCHKKSDLKDEILFKNVAFSHSRHIEQMKRQKQLRCTTCHSQLVQGAHMIVTEVECFICHFYKTKDQKEYVTECGSCHFEARGDIKVSTGFIFNHKRYVSRGIKCDVCHTNVVSGDGHIPEFACLQCHNRREILEAKYTAETLHRKHVTDHKVECFTCHSPIKHKIIGLHYTAQTPEACAECHRSGLHSPKASMYMGKGARLVQQWPNRMALINMDCNVCHKDAVGRPGLESCRECHGTLTDTMVNNWRKVLKEKLGELTKEIAAARAAVNQKSSPALKKKLDDAVFNYDFINRGNGVHNIVYSMRIMEATKYALLEVQGKATGKAVPYKLSCAGVCHTDIAERKVVFGSTSFPHAMHIEGDDSCAKCHSPYAQHGKTVLSGCSSCHHGEGMGKVMCADCHRTEEGMFRGKGVKGINPVADAMWKKVSCQQCHPDVKRGKTGGAGVTKGACTSCHKKGYGDLVDEWATRQRGLQSRYGNVLVGLEKDISAIEVKEGGHSVPLRALYDEITQDIQFILEGNWCHNPQYAEAIAKKIDTNVASLQSMIKSRQAGKAIVLRNK